MSTYSATLDSSVPLTSEGLWLRNKAWDLTFISLSAVLVAVPILTYLFANQATDGINTMLRSIGIDFVWDDDASRNLVNGLIALFIGGPHMYATYTRTALEKNFSSKHKWIMVGSIFIPIYVIYFGVTNFQFLITFFFFWASIHIMHQLAYLMECYNRKAKLPPSFFSKFIDYSVVFSSLYPIATYKFVHSQFAIGQNVIYFPDFLKLDFIVYFVWAYFALSIMAFIWKTTQEMKAGIAHYPKIILMSLTVVIAFFIPAFPNLDVAFQGFNAWHSFQYLGLTYYINRLRHEKGEIATPFIDNMSKTPKPWKFYFFNVGLTVMAVVTIGLLIYFKPVLGLSFDQCYYIVVLSFLLMHYLHDHLLFTNFDAVLLKR
ncbi:MAG: hypothetical protein EPO24_07240 [Bacteroidetes bacterium]|nr:MAG: hypothetical protein EPO24_07240 [Bacteroidota bacterium]